MKRLQSFCSIFLCCFIAGQTVAQTYSPDESRERDFWKSSDRVHQATTIYYNRQLSTYSKPRPFEFITKLPADFSHMGPMLTSREGLLLTAGVGLLSYGLIRVDQQATNWISKTSVKWDIDNETSYDVLLKLGKTKILQVPNNSTTLFYQLGQGGTSLLLAGSIWAYGKLWHDYRATATASDITRTFISLAILTQAIKRITGRESPFMATAPGGRWKLFPSFSAFQKNTPAYDAFPSGHLSTLMATITVLKENYPEKKWIGPVGYGLMGICMWTMADIQVHWIGDYPLAIAIGYLSAKASTWEHRQKKIKMLPHY
ncbi:MAG: phosphatase PAP2 family protein [Chitinophagaceae bacterium]